MGSMRSMIEESETSRAYGRMLGLVGKLRQEHGHGNWAQLDRRLGHSEGYLGRVLRQEIRLTTDMLLRILEVLNVEPGLFFQHVFAPSSDPADILALLQRQMSSLRRSDGSKEPVLDMATLAWLQDLEAASQRLAKQRTTFSHELDSEARIALMGQLEELQGRLDTQPGDVAKELAAWLARVAGRISADPDGMCELLAKGLATQSQALLMGVKPGQVQPGAACHHLRVAWQLARGPEARSQVLLSAVQLATRMGAVESAQVLIPQALEASVLAHHPSRVGRVMLLKGNLHVLRRDWQRGAESLGAALSFFDEDQRHSRWLSYLGSARCALEIGQLAAAKNALQLTDSCCPEDVHPGGRWARSQRMELQAALAEAEGRWDEAAVHHRAARQTCQALGHFAAALLASLREARVLLALGQQQEVQKLTAQCMGWTRPLRRQRRMCEVINDMARLALTGELNPQWLRAVEMELEPLADLHGLEMCSAFQGPA